MQPRKKHSQGKRVKKGNRSGGKKQALPPRKPRKRHSPEKRIKKDKRAGGEKQALPPRKLWNLAGLLGSVTYVDAHKRRIGARASPTGCNDNVTKARVRRDNELTEKLRRRLVACKKSRAGNAGQNE